MEKRRRMLYPIGIQNFEDLRRKGFVYVDKKRTSMTSPTRANITSSAGVTLWQVAANIDGGSISIYVI